VTFVPLLRHAVRARRGLCHRCGYDLRADFATGCPECGWRQPPPADLEIRDPKVEL